jgi:hypothetical protein
MLGVVCSAAKPDNCGPNATSDVPSDRQTNPAAIDRSVARLTPGSRPAKPDRPRSGSPERHSGRHTDQVGVVRPSSLPCHQLVEHRVVVRDESQVARVIVTRLYRMTIGPFRQVDSARMPVDKLSVIRRVGELVDAEVVGSNELGAAEGLAHPARVVHGEDRHADNQDGLPGRLLRCRCCLGPPRAIPVPQPRLTARVWMSARRWAALSHRRLPRWNFSLGKGTRLRIADCPKSAHADSGLSCSVRVAAAWFCHCGNLPISIRPNSRNRCSEGPDSSDTNSADRRKRNSLARASASHAEGH